MKTFFKLFIATLIAAVIAISVMSCQRGDEKESDTDVTGATESVDTTEQTDSESITEKESEKTDLDTETSSDETSKPVIDDDSPIELPIVP